MFYTYNQNNSGGGFDYDAERGISVFVIVEADSAEGADARAREIGLYFDGVEDGNDCDCCGDRWSEAWSGDQVPSIYGTPLENHRPYGTWMGDLPEAYVHYADGRVVGRVFETSGSN
ncbi:DUF7296 family protein [Kitasatospora sp. NPDC001132]